MNKRQRVVLGVGGLVVAAMMLFPPWYWSGDVFVGWRFVGSASRLAGAYADLRLAWDRLGLQLGVVAVLFGAAYVYFGKGGKGGKGGGRRAGDTPGASGNGGGRRTGDAPPPG